MIIIAIYSIEELSDPHTEAARGSLKMVDLASFPLFFGIIVFGFEGNTTNPNRSKGNAVSLNIHASMKEQNKFIRIMSAAVGMCTFLFILFPSLAYAVTCYML